MKGFYKFFISVILFLILWFVTKIYFEVRMIKFEIQILEPKIKSMMLDRDIEESQKDLQETIDRIKSIS